MFKIIDSIKTPYIRGFYGGDFMETLKLNINSLANTPPSGEIDNVELYLREHIKYDIMFSSASKYLIKANITPCVSFATEDIKIKKEDYNKKFYKVTLTDGFRNKEYLLSKFLDKFYQDDILDLVELRVMNLINSMLPHNVLINKDLLNGIIESGLPFNNKIYIRFKTQKSIDEVTHIFNLKEKPTHKLFSKNYLSLGKTNINWYSGGIPSGSIVINYEQFENNHVLIKFINYLLNSYEIYLDSKVQTHFREAEEYFKKYKDLSLL